MLNCFESKITLIEVIFIENWKPVIGFENLYEVSDFGRVRSVDRIIISCNGVKRHFYGKILTPKLNKYGYPTLGLWNCGKRTDCVIHRLVAKAFIENPNDYEQVNHLDGDKTNNHVDNLEWCDGFRNIQHAYELGLIPLQKGESHGGHKLTDNAVREIRRLRKCGYKYSEIAIHYNVSDRTIGQICRGENWTHIV